MIDWIQEKKVIGIKQCKKSILNGEGKILYIADDADKKLTSPLISVAEQKSVPVTVIDTMQKLGKMCSIDVKAAAALILK